MGLFAAEAAALALLAGSALAAVLLVAELLRVGFAGTGWSDISMLAFFAGLLGAAGLAWVPFAFGSAPRPVGTRVRDRAVLDRVRALAAEAGVRPPAELRLHPDGRVRLVHGGRTWPGGIPRRVLEVGVGALAALGRDDIDALVVEVLVRDTTGRRISATARAAAALAAPRPLPSVGSVPLLSLGFVAGLWLLIAVIVGIPRAVAAGVAWPLLLVHRRIDAALAVRAEQLAEARIGQSRLQQVRGQLEVVEAHATHIELRARDVARRGLAPGDTAAKLVQRLAWCRAVGLHGAGPGELWLSLTPELLAEVGQGRARRLGGHAVPLLGVPPSRHPPLVGGPVEVVGLPDPDRIARVAAELEELDPDELSERASPDLDVLDALERWEAATRARATLWAFWLEAPGGARLQWEGEALNPAQAGGRLAEVDPELLPLAVHLARRFGAGLARAQQLGPDWERALLDAVRLGPWLGDVWERLAIVRLGTRISKPGRRHVRAWEQVEAQLSELEVPLDAFPELRLPERPRASWTKIGGEVVALLGDVARAQGLARDHALDVLDGVALAEDGQPCPFPALQIPELPDAAPETVPLADLPRRAAAVHGVPRPLHVGFAGLAAAAGIGLRLLGGGTVVVVSNGSAVEVAVEIDGEALSLGPHDVVRRWRFVPGAVEIASSAGGVPLEEVSIVAGLTPTQWIYNVASRGLLIERDYVYTEHGGGDPYPARVLGVGPLLQTDEAFVFEDTPDTVELGEYEDEHHLQAVEDLARGAPASRLVDLFYGDLEAWKGPQSWADVQEAQLASFLLGVTALDPPDANTRVLDALAVDALRGREDELHAAREARSTRVRARAEADGGAAWTAWAWIAPPDEVLGAVERALAADPTDAGALCLRGRERARELDWAGAGRDWADCATHGSDDLRIRFARHRLAAARLHGEPLDALLGELDDPDVAARYASYPPDAAVPALDRASWWLAHGDLARAAAELGPAETPGQQALLLRIGLSDGADPAVPPPIGPDLDANLWVDVAAARADPASSDLPDADWCELQAVEGVIRGADPLDHGKLYAAAAVLAGPCRPDELVRRARALSVPGTIPWLTTE